VVKGILDFFYKRVVLQFDVLRAVVQLPLGDPWLEQFRAHNRALVLHVVDLINFVNVADAPGLLLRPQFGLAILFGYSRSQELFCVLLNFGIGLTLLPTPINLREPVFLAITNLIVIHK